MNESSDKTDAAPQKESGLNEDTLICLNCGSKILKPGFGARTQIMMDLPQMDVISGKTTNSTEMETLSDFWTIKDIYHFENIGFSKDVGHLKYLICADCETGPIGWHDKNTKESYLSVSRVSHKVKKENT